MANNLIDVFEKNKYNLHAASRKSRAWFDQQVLLLRQQNIRASRIMKGDDLTTNILPGKMYCFFYDAKHKDTLPYWDQFPLLLPFDKWNGGFMGLNLHYLPYQLRAQLLDRLMYFANNKAMDETTKLRFSWGTIKEVSKFSMAKSCVKQYLTEHLRSPFKEIPANNWATAVMLPIEQFVGSSKQAVWQDSIKIGR
jgi:hypothetical protein